MLGDRHTMLMPSPTVLWSGMSTGHPLRQGGRGGGPRGPWLRSHGVSLALVLIPLHLNVRTTHFVLLAPRFICGSPSVVVFGGGAFGR